MRNRSVKKAGLRTPAPHLSPMPHQKLLWFYASLDHRCEYICIYIYDDTKCGFLATRVGIGRCSLSHQLQPRAVLDYCYPPLRRCIFILYIFLYIYMSTYIYTHTYINVCMCIYNKVVLLLAALLQCIQSIDHWWPARRVEVLAAK
jgi:hypothetical protein